MSSLFGSLNSSQNTAAKPSLFSTPSTNVNTSSQPGGLFSGLNSKPATSTGGLFGGLGSSTSQPQQQQQTGTGGGLFGGLGASTTQTQTGGGLFSSLGGASTSQPQQQTGGGLFGGLGTSTSQPQQQTGGLFSGLGANTQQQQQAGGLGGSTQPQVQGSLLSSTNQGPLQQNGQSRAYFDAILEKSRKRAHGETTSEDLPQLHLGLGDLRQRIKRLGPASQDRNVDGRAHYLLAASGVDPGAAIRDLNFFSSTTGRVEQPQSQAPPDTDVEGYLANLQTQTTLSMISDGLARSVRDFDNFLEENVTMEWDAQRKRIYQHFGIKPKEVPGGRGSFAASAADTQGGFGRSRRSKAAGLAGSRASAATEGAFGKATLQKSVIGAAGPIGSGHQPLFSDIEKKMETNALTVAGPQDRFQREKQSRFADKVQNLNLARLQKRCYPVSHEFATVVKESGEAHGPEIIKAYRALIEIVGENPEIESLSDPLAAKERQFAQPYLDEAPSTPEAAQAKIRVKKTIIRGGARCLERLFFEELETLIAKSPREANLGGIPNVISKVKAYTRLCASRKDLAPDNTNLQQLDDDYVWALVFFLLRSGHVEEAVEYVTANAVAFRAIDRNFAAYITDYSNNPERRLRRDLQDRINSEYNQRLRIAPENSIDPYRMACYKVIGRCDLRSRSFEGLTQNIEDFTWLQLVLAREINRVDEIASEVYGLEDVQKTMKEIGGRYFVKGGAEIGSSYGAWVFLQVSVGLFEDAVAYLYPYSYVDGAHLAIALGFYGLLRVSDPSVAGEDLLNFTTRQNSQISFGRMVGLYTRDFRAANVTAAVDYLTLICLNKDVPGQSGRNQVTLCHEALRELVLESREFALLLGDIRHDGQRIKGVIEERMKLIGLDETHDFVRTITIQAASVADDNGRMTDAVLLYHLAGEFDNVIVIITRALSEAVAVPIGHDQMKLQPLKPRAVADPQKEQNSSLSLTAVDDPVILAENITRLYQGNKMYTEKIKITNQEACRALMDMSKAKVKVAEERWMEALDVSLLFWYY